MDLQHVVINALIFIGFYFIALAHHCITNRCSPGHAGHMSASLFAASLSPAVHDAMRDFAAHIVVYSGYIIPSH